jgi:hypothetical protein
MASFLFGWTEQGLVFEPVKYSWQCAALLMVAALAPAASGSPAEIA